MSTGIPYVDESCNAVIGCSKCSPACKNCWAVETVRRLNECFRFSGHNKHYLYNNAIDGNGNWSGKAEVDFDAFKKCKGRPKTFLLSSLGDWLHESLSTEQINGLLERMGEYAGHGHRFYTLTKRPERWKEIGPIPPNVWLGASVWDQDSYDRTMQYRSGLIHPCADWLSMEPLLGPINLAYKGWLRDWVVVGAESGKNRRPCKVEWVRSIVQQCKEYRIPCFVKQIDLDGKCSTDPLDWPMDIAIQEFPK
jgi:protein gp37